MHAHTIRITWIHLFISISSLRIYKIKCGEGFQVFKIPLTAMSYY